jgi:hypothetical protein
VGLEFWHTPPAPLAEVDSFRTGFSGDAYNIKVLET